MINRKINSFPIILIGFLLLFSLFGCTQSTPAADEFGIYYLNSKQTGLVKESYSIISSVTSDRIREILAMLSTETMDDDRVNPIPDSLAKIDYELVDGNLLLHFEPEYAQMSVTREILMRGAVVKTFLQLDEVSTVTFYIANDPLTDASGNAIGAMNSDSFLDTFGEREEALESDTFTLFYSTKDGRGLMKKTRLLHYNNTMSRESVVLLYLSKNPGSDDGARAVLSPQTKILSATTKDGICYVKLDAGFLVQQTGVSTEVAIYGIVDSLTSLDDVSKVDLSVESSSDGVVPEAL